MEFDLLCGTSFGGKETNARKYGPEKRMEYVIHYITDGSGYFISEGKNFLLSKGQSFVVYPGRVIEYGPNPHEDWSYVWVGMNSPFVGTLFQQIGFQFDDCVIEKLPAKEVIPFYENVLNIGNEMADNKARNALVYAVLGRYLDIVSSKTVHEKEMMYLDIVNWIQNNFYKGECMPSALADMYKISQSTLYRLFMEKSGRSPQQYIQLYRIEQAKNMLSMSISVKEVAFSCGFKDVLYFSRIFKKIVGVAPSIYKLGQQQADWKNYSD